MKHVRLFGLAALALLASVAHAGDLKSVVPMVETMAANAAVVDAVASQNSQGMTLDAIKATDTEWQAGGAAATVSANLENAAAAALKTAMADKPYLVEGILTDNQGANVAMTQKTSDYWQGDEPKFIKAWADGKGDVYISRPKRDESTGEVIAQISVPVRKDGAAIGTLTIGVVVDKIP